MMLCVIAKLDDASTGKLETLRRNAFPDYAAARPLHGHITIAAYVGDDETRFIHFCREAMDGIHSFTVAYETIEILEETSILAAIPSKTGVLDSLHQMIAAQFRDDLDRWTGSDRWYPHTTLLYNPKIDLHTLRRQMMKEFVPISADICRIEFSCVFENGYEIVDHMDLPPDKRGQSR